MTKKIFSLLLTLVISIGAWASDIEIDGIWYNFNSTDLTATVTYKGASYTQYKDEYTGDITIPSTVIYEKKEYSVTHIGSFAFSGCQNLVSVTIGDNVTNINDYAFYSCSNLTSVTIGKNVTSIYSSAFYSCSNLTSVTLNSNTLVSKKYSSSSDNIRSMFKYQVTEYILGNSVTSIGEYAFAGCSGLTSVTIPNSVTSIGNSAFTGCSGLTSVMIPYSVTSIGENAFSGCSGLTSVIMLNPSAPKRDNSKFYTSAQNNVPLYVLSQKVSQSYVSHIPYKDKAKILRWEKLR